MLIRRLIVIFISSLVTIPIYACTEMMFMYKDQHIVARNMDWINNNAVVVINPIGKKWTAWIAHGGETPLTWQAKYGAVTFNLASPNGKVLQAAVQGGMNQYGLIASLLEHDKEQYAKPNPHKPSIYNTQVIQYWLDNFKTVAQVIAGLKNINIIPLSWRGNPVHVHFVLHDASGASAIVEYLNGKLVVHKGMTLPYKVLANRTFADSKKTLQQYKEFGGKKTLPGGYSSEARYVRAAAFLKRLPTPTNTQEAVGFAFAGLQDVAEAPGTPWPTQWSVVYNTKTGQMFYRTLQDPRIRSFDLRKLNFSKQVVIPINPKN